MCLCQCRVVRFRVQREVMTTHPLHPRGCDPFHIDQGFIRCHGEMQVSRKDPMESAQIGSKRRARPLHRSGRALHAGPLRRHCPHTRARRSGRWHGTDDSLHHAPLSSREPHAAHTRCSPISREVTRITGGRLLAEVPCSVHIVPRRWRIGNC
jgi:hypothetical protein